MRTAAARVRAMPDLDKLAGAPPAVTVPEAVDRLRAISAALPTDDGVAQFARMYLDVTVGVDRSLVAHTMRDPVYLARLDVVFANLFFDAFGASVRAPSTVPRAWAPLFDCRRRRGVAPLQHALAGMNAHINRDLPIALVTTAAELGLPIDDDSPQHSDFLTVNVLLAEAEQRVKADFATGLIGVVDRLLGGVDDRVAMWDVSRARDAAWANAHLLWAVRDDADLSTEFVETLDRTVGFAGRGLLVPSLWRFW